MLICTNLLLKQKDFYFVVKACVMIMEPDLNYILLLDKLDTLPL